MLISFKAELVSLLTFSGEARSSPIERRETGDDHCSQAHKSHHLRNKATCFVLNLETTPIDWAQIICFDCISSNALIGCPPTNGFDRCELWL